MMGYNCNLDTDWPMFNHDHDRAHAGHLRFQVAILDCNLSSKSTITGMVTLQGIHITKICVCRHE